MRTDCTIDTKQVYCPNATWLAYGKGAARFGDVVWYKEWLTDGTYDTRIGRVIGRVAYAPACGETKPISNYLCVAVLSNGYCAAFERWVNPEDVIEVNSFEDFKRGEGLRRWFFDTAEPCKRADVTELRRALDQGYNNDIPGRIAEVKQRKAQAIA
jgi:hypothetical protein